jgi:predicted AAA+ superfamily ATPase
MSFREYLGFNKILKYPLIRSEDVFAKYKPLTSEITSTTRVLPHFQEYLKHGFYPFYNVAKDRFYDRINNIVNVIIETDIPAVSEIGFETTAKLKKLLSLLAASTPYTPNLKLLAAQLFVTDNRTLLKYFSFLEKAGLIQTLGPEAKGDRILNKPDKIYLNNTNLMHALLPGAVNNGTARETFLLNQLTSVYSVSYPKNADFMVDNKYLIEVGGKSKKNKQIADIANSWIAMDNIETGFANKIPIWLFGFMY